MKTNEYLYGSEVEVKDIPEDIIESRLELLRKHLNRLLEHSYYNRDTKRVNDVLDGIEFWENINKR